MAGGTRTVQLSEKQSFHLFDLSGRITSDGLVGNEHVGVPV